MWVDEGDDVMLCAVCYLKTPIFTHKNNVTTPVLTLLHTIWLPSEQWLRCKLASLYVYSTSYGWCKHRHNTRLESCNMQRYHQAVRQITCTIRQPSLDIRRPHTKNMANDIRMSASTRNKFWINTCFLPRHYSITESMTCIPAVIETFSTCSHTVK